MAEWPVNEQIGLGYREGILSRSFFIYEYFVMYKIMLIV